MEPEALWARIVAAAEDKKAQNVVVFGIEPLSIVADFLVLCSGTSTTHVGAIAHGILDAAESEGVLGRVEGLNENKWVLIDFGTVVVHVMTDEIRKFYALEELWARAEVAYRRAEPAGA